jgi:hypothetical protein
VKHKVQSGIWIPTQHLALGPRKTTGNPDRVGRWQELPGANLLITSSPALNMRTPMSVPICKCTHITTKRRTDCVSIIITHQLLVFREVIAVYCEKHMKRI